MATQKMQGKPMLHNPRMMAFADGGKVDPDELMRQMAAKYGAPSASSAQTVPQPAPQAVAQPAPQPQQRGIISVLKNRGKQIDGAVGYADGGTIGESPEQVMARIQAKYGVSGNAAPSVQAPQPSPQPAQQQAPQNSGGILGRAVGLFSGRRAQIDKAAGYKNGGKICAYGEGGKIKGPGTSKSDSIPGEVVETGEPIQVANKERIVSNDQDSYLEAEARRKGFKSLDDELESATGKPVGPTIKYGKKAAATGMAPDEPTDPDQKKIGGVAYDTSQPSPVQFNPGSVIGQTAKVIGSGISNAASSVGSGISNALSLAGDALTPSRVNATPNRDGLETSASASPGAPSVAASPSNSTAQASSLPPQNSVPGQVGKGIAVKDVGDGINKVTGGTLKSPLYTNLSDANEAIAGLRNQTVSGQGEGLQRFANANSIRQSMIDEQPRGIAAAIGNPQAADTAATFAKWDQEDQSKKIAQLPYRQQQAALAALKDQTDRRGQDLSNMATLRGQDINAANSAGQLAAQLRGQDLHAQTAAAQLAGNPLDQQIKQQSLSKQAKLDNLVSQASSETDPAKRSALLESILAMQGKDMRDDRYLKVDGGESIGPDGMTKIKSPSGVFDKSTQRFIPMNQLGAQSSSPSFSDFSKQIRAKNPGVNISDADMQAAYKKQFGGA